MSEFVDKYLTEPHGYACELGAYDGSYFSATLPLEQRGWTVLCIEPNPDLEEQGRSLRKLWRQIACGPEDRDDGLFLNIGGASNSGLIIDGKLPYTGVVSVADAIGVPVRRLDRVLEEAGFPRLDFLSLDVEGYELEVLQGFTIERWKPRLMFIERYGPSPEMETPEGYEFLGKDTEDNVYLRKA